MTTLVMSEVVQSIKGFKLKLDLIKTLSCLRKHQLCQYISFPLIVTLLFCYQCKQYYSQYFALKTESNRANPVLAESPLVRHQIFVSLQTAIMVHLVLMFAAVIEYVYGRPPLPPLPVKGEHLYMYTYIFNISYIHTNQP